MNTPAHMLQNADTEKVIFQKMVTENGILLILKRKVWNGRFEYILQIEGQTKRLQRASWFHNGEPTTINVELLFRDLFALRDRFKELGMVIKNGEVYLPDLEERGV